MKKEMRQDKISKVGYTGTVLFLFGFSLLILGFLVLCVLGTTIQIIL